MTLLNRSCCRLTWGCLWLITLQAIRQRKSFQSRSSIDKPTQRRSHPCHYISMSTTLCPLVRKSCSEWRWSVRPPRTPLKLYNLHTQLHSCLGLSRSEGTLIFERDASCCLRSVEAWLSHCHWIDRLDVHSFFFYLIYLTCDTVYKD